ncbi:MAG: hypothetical protein M1833_004138 [Piccolia ochrophora]|nr:MAG: hypothetical protein M1833_004138 [Piccolia ochrophora]
MVLSHGEEEDMISSPRRLASSTTISDSPQTTRNVRRASGHHLEAQSRSSPAKKPASEGGPRPSRDQVQHEIQVQIQAQIQNSLRQSDDVDFVLTLDDQAASDHLDNEKFAEIEELLGNEFAIRLRIDSSSRRLHVRGTQTWAHTIPRSAELNVLTEVHRQLVEQGIVESPQTKLLIPTGGGGIESLNSGALERSRKVPDGCWISALDGRPGVVLEVAYSQPAKSLWADVKEWLDPKAFLEVQVVIAIAYNEHVQDPVEQRPITLYIFRSGDGDRPRLTDRAILSPEALRRPGHELSFSLSELFGPADAMEDLIIQVASAPEPSDRLTAKRVALLKKMPHLLDFIELLRQESAVTLPLTIFETAADEAVMMQLHTTMRDTKPSQKRKATEDAGPSLAEKQRRRQENMEAIETRITPPPMNEPVGFSFMDYWRGVLDEDGREV